jgi:hypothetical protein
MSKMYCVSCGRESSYDVSESFLFVIYQCNGCTFKNGNPPGLRKIAESVY